MGINANKVFVGLADQSSTVGALSRGTALSTIPADYTAAATAIANFTSSGYISEEGATLTTNISVTKLREWNRAAVRQLLEDFDGNISLTLIQLDEEGAKQAFGTSNVTKTAATSTHGEQLRIALGAHIEAPQAWALRVKDGDAKCIVLIPNGQVTSGATITFSANEAISLPVTIDANDVNGQSIYVYFDDGQKSS